MNRIIKYISIEEMNEHLAYCKKYRLIKYEKPFSPVGLNAFIEDGMVQFKLTFKKDEEVIDYITYKDGRDHEQNITGGEAYRILRMNADFPIREEFPFSASPFLWKRPKYEGQWVDAICYDINSAYAWAMCQPMPDTSVPPKAKVIEDGEVGFDYDGDIQRKGYSMYVFKMLDHSPFTNFAHKWFDRKKQPKFKRKAKNVLVYSVGYLQRKNPYLRAYIVGLCNDLIHSLIDENTIYCNTDSIVSLKERPDLTLGNGLGEWKIEHKGKFAYNGFNYQWKDEEISYRGIPKSWFPKNFDITKDDLPLTGNMWYYDDKKYKLRRDKYETTSKICKKSL